MTPTLLALLVGFSAATISSVSAQEPTPSPEKQPVSKPDKDVKIFTAEQVAESTIFVYGSRNLLAKIRRNGVESGRICKPGCELGKVEEATYQRRFVRGESMDKDKIRLDQKMPTLEYSLIFGSGQLWGLINGSAFTPRQDATNTFLAQHRHSLDSLLRYKENGATLAPLRKDKQKGLDLFIVEVIDKDKQSTRFFISVKTLHVLWLEYDDNGSDGAGMQKFSRKFMDYRVAQGTLVPYRTVLFEGSKQVQETRVSNVTYGVRLDDALFKSPEA